MRERAELTGNTGYPTLNRAPFLRGVNAMDNKTPEKPIVQPKAAKPEKIAPQMPQPDSPMPQPSMEDVAVIADFLKKMMSEGESRGAFESRKVLEAMMEGSREAGVFDNPQDQETAASIIGSRYDERLAPVDTYNLQNPEPYRVGAGMFGDLVTQANIAEGAGQMANSLLESLVQDANKRYSRQQRAILKDSSGVLDDESDEKLTRLEAEYRNAIEGIKSVYQKINPIYLENPGDQDSGSRNTEALQATSKFRELVESAKQQSGEEIITDLNTPAGKAIVEHIENGFEFGTREHYYIAEYVARDGKKDFDKKIRELLFEQIWERFVGRADKLPEEIHYRETLGGLEATGIFDKIKGLAETEFNEEHHGKKTNEFLHYLEELGHARQNMHDLNSSFRVGDEYKKAVVQQISGKGLNFIQNELSGVNDVVLLWEKYAAAKVAETHQWLSQGDIEDIQKSVSETIEQLSEDNALEREGRHLTKWERDRALKLGKILFAGTQRMAMYVAYGNVAQETQGRIASIPYEYVARAIFGFKMTSVRFFTDSPQMAYMNKIFKEMIYDKNGKDNGKYLELFGADKRVIASNSLGAQDIESHGWRSQLIYLNNILLETGEGDNAKNQTLVEFINDAVKRHQSPDADLNFQGMGGVDKAQEKAFHQEIDDVILGQRLYLSVLTRADKMSDELKEKIWSKIAILKPSTIMSLLPNDMILNKDEGEMLNQVRKKLYAAEIKRVKKDTHKWASISEHGHDPHVLSRKQIHDEVGDFKSALAGTNDEYKYQILKHGNFSKEEAAFVQEMIRRGISQAGKLSKAKLSQTLVIDDAPFAAWAKTGTGETGRSGLASEDIVRILFSDQGTITEAWNAINGHVDSPQKPPQEPFTKFVDGFGSVYGRGHAQETIEPFIKAYLKFCSADTEALWFGGIDKILNKPGSEMAEFFRESHIEMDERKRADFLKLLAQLNVISDDYKAAHEKGEKTQLDSLREDLDADKFALWVRLLRMVTQYLPIVALNMLKNLFIEPAKKV